MMCGLIILMLAAAAHASCPASYEKSGSSLCLSDHPNLDKSASGVTAEQKVEIINHHNDLRRNVIVEPNDLSPSHDPEVVWDDLIAAVAQQWAQNQCAMVHDTHSARAIPEYPGVSIGQNAAFSYPPGRSWTEVIDGWYNEKPLFSYGTENSAAGHFTQVVSDKVTRIGCGRAVCNNGRPEQFSYCNYASGQQNYSIPFETGTRGSGCSGNEVNGLCAGDCTGLLCFNGGSINYDSCTCNCRGVYSGADCSTVANCPSDKSWCGTDWPKSYCTRFTNVPDECPHMCEVC